MSHGDADSSRRDRSSLWTIVVAGGSGLRFGGRKQFADLAGRSVLQRSVDAAVAVSDGVVIVAPADACDDVDTRTEPDATTLVRVVPGGDTRAASVRAGLGAVPAEATNVLVHDAARPLASRGLFESVRSALIDGAVAVIPVVPVTDTIRERDGGVVDRGRLLAVQTPQGFDAATLREAHESGGEATDDASLVEALGRPITLVEGEVQNTKLTNPTDLVAATAIVQNLQELA